MTRSPSVSRALRGAVLLLLAACTTDTTTAPDVRSDLDLRLLHVAHGTPPLVSTQVSFYAVKGKAAAVDLYFRPQPGSADSLKMLEYRMTAGSLDRRPDGSVIAAGDSVLITLTVTDPYHLAIEYQPSGLKFSATERPTLTLYWSACGDDLNYDGVVDSADAVIVDQLGIWRQEAAGEPWFRQSGTVTKGSKNVQIPLDGFSGYVLAF